MFAQLRKFAALLVLAAVAQPAYALPQVTVSGNVYVTNIAGQTVSTSPFQAAVTPAVSTAVAATTTGPPAAPPTIYTYTTIIEGVTYTNIDTYTPTYEPTVKPTLTLQGTIMPYSQFISQYYTAKSSARSAHSLPDGVVWMGVTTLLGFVLGVRAVGLL
ncbi:hypothetical protein FRC05_011265 [Tulasnella sp. 425]|nr:hypothetical protein FRC05_011265 [Tulasnella sp. 425]